MKKIIVSIICIGISAIALGSEPPKNHYQVGDECSQDGKNGRLVNGSASKNKSKSQGNTYGGEANVGGDILIVKASGTGSYEHDHQKTTTKSESVNRLECDTSESQQWTGGWK